MGATARAQPNIALIKYWGKSDVARNLPAVGSISITLDDLYTTMAVESDAAAAGDVLIVNGVEDVSMLSRISKCLDSVLGTDRDPMRVTSEFNFPLAAGLASSASAFAALVVAADAAAGSSRPTAELARLAGAASGSAARSLYGGFVELDNTNDEIGVHTLVPAADWPLRVVAAITELGPKAVGSTEAMEISRKSSPFYDRWIEQQPDDLAVAREAIEARDFRALAGIAEHNCLKMHSVMWASRPPLSYWNSATLKCMETIRSLQREGVDVFFTIDAGPQVKAVCTADAESQVADALRSAAGVREIMQSGLGDGAQVL